MLTVVATRSYILTIFETDLNAVRHESTDVFIGRYVLQDPAICGLIPKVEVRLHKAKRSDGMACLSAAKDAHG